MTDDSIAIQAALNACKVAGGGEVQVPYRDKGICNIGATLRIYGGTKLTIARGVTMRRTFDGRMLVNGDSAQNFGGYTGHSNIIVEGGLWDMRGTVMTGPQSCFAFGHCTNITFKDLTVKDVAGYHAMEINSTNGFQAINCRFIGFKDTGNRGFSEAVQFDLAKGAGYFGEFGPHDHTPCKNVAVINCHFGLSGTTGMVGWGRGIGSHSATRPNYHERIRITGNNFEDCVQYGVGAYNWRDVIIANNTFLRCGSALKIRPISSADTNDTLDVNGSQTGSSQEVNGFVVADNTVTGTLGYNDAITVEGDLRASDGVVTRLRDLTLTGNQITTAGGQGGIRLERISDFTCADNQVRDVAYGGIGTDNVTQGVIHDNNVDKVGQAGTSRPISIINSSFMSVAGNKLKSGNEGILLQSSSDIFITGNSVRDAAAYGIRCSTATSNNITITNNDINCPSATHALSITSSISNGRRWGNNLHGGALSDGASCSTSTADDGSGGGGGSPTANGAVFRAYKANTPSVSSQTTTTCSDTVSNATGGFSHQGDGVARVPITGYYVLTAQASWNNIPSAAGFVYVWISRCDSGGNEIEQLAFNSMHAENSSPIADRCNCTIIVPLTEGWYIKAYTMYSGGVASNTQQGGSVANNFCAGLLPA